ncbi:hypothetical protein QOZ80_2AG0131720 [Eleusine coracana subsp. coracana]|nr:hypothetical protein QOZ80_2AG0131720 [Eleusine coracana subsp. coracana]
MLGPLFSAAMEPQRCHRELLLLPTSMPRETAFFPAPRPAASSSSDHHHHPHLDLSLSISIGSPPPEESAAAADHHQSKKVVVDVQALKLQAAEQARMASAERAYADRVMELARRELELAEREFARARAIWDRARGEVEKVDRIKAAR